MPAWLTVQGVLFAISIVLFLLDALAVDTRRLHATPLGLACLAAAWLAP
jgi:uncharacterized membrane protein YhaH (DUF805 family)